MATPTASYKTRFFTTLVVTFVAVFAGLTWFNTPQASHPAEGTGPSLAQIAQDIEQDEDVRPGTVNIVTSRVVDAGGRVCGMATYQSRRGYLAFTHFYDDTGSVTMDHYANQHADYFRTFCKE